MFIVNNFEKEFFVLNSENINSFNSNFFGYMVTKNQIIFDLGSLEGKQSYNGAYVLVDVNSNHVTVSQDNMGSYGLYLFEQDDYFALSNSFLKLTEFIKEKYPISLNETFAKTFLSAEKTSISYDETLINEIKLIPKNYKLIIDVENNEITYELNSLNNDSFELDTEEAFSCLDNWFNNWIKVIRNLINNSKLLTLDLDANVSSLVLMAMILNADINLDNLSIFSEDTDLLSIAEDFGFKINNNKLIGVSENDLNASLNLSFYTKLGFKKEYDFPNIYDEQFFSLTNKGSLNYNENYPINIEEYIENIKNNASNYSNKYEDIIEKYLWENVHKIEKEYKIYDIHSTELLDKYYQNTIFRNQLGKNNVESFLSNKININPLNDTILQGIKTENDKRFYLIIVSRYCPSLLNYDIYDLKSQKETINYANEINKKYPYKKINQEVLSIPENKNDYPTNNKINNDEIHELLTKIFYSNSFKHTFFKYFSEEIYNNITDLYLTRNNYFYSEIYAIISIVKIINEVEYSQNKKYNSATNWLKSFITINNTEESIKTPFNAMLTQYYTSRIDIKNNGTYTNQIKIIDISDTAAKITSPSWFTNEKGQGKCVISEKGEISFKIKCIGDGDLNIELRTLDIKDRNNNRFPVYIDYLSVKVDGNEILNENTLAWHNDPVYYHKKVWNGEIIKIDATWQPFTKLSKYQRNKQ